jgi:hypothetical protein
LQGQPLEPSAAEDALTANDALATQSTRAIEEEPPSGGRGGSVWRATVRHGVILPLFGRRRLPHNRRGERRV